MAREVGQALYGYKNGHRLIASSGRLPTEAGRTLRSLTDMGFDGRSKTYITSVPLPELRSQALVRTWPAPEAPRPGSVWSHVLLIDFVDLGEPKPPGAFAELFRRPTVDKEGGVETAPYECPLPLPAARAVPGAGALERADRLRLLWAAYGGENVGIVRDPEPAAFEQALFGLWTQQWPRLRRSFGFRTRYRVAGKAAGFDLQLVERLQRDQEEASAPVEPPAWLLRLERDLVRPNPDFRDFLHRFGAESQAGVDDLRRLVEVELCVERADPDPVAASERVSAAFPKAGQMHGLKEALLGPADAPHAIGIHDERWRLKGVAYAKPASALDLTRLQVAERLEALWTDRRSDAADLLVELATEDPPNDKMLRLVARVAVARITPEETARVAATDPGLAVALVAKRPDLLRSATIWRSDEEVAAGLLDMVAEMDKGTRTEVLDSLVRGGAAAAAAQIIRQRPAEWWDALIATSRAVAGGRSLARAASALGRLLEAAGPASIGSAPARLDDDALTLLALAAPPTTGVWRQIAAGRWLAVAPALASLDNTKLRPRALVVLLAATGLASTAPVRRGLWLGAFAPLHAFLEAEEIGDSELAVLDELLPGGGAELPQRLREGVIREMRKSKWPPPDVEMVLDAMGAHRAAMLKALESKGKKKKGWLREVRDFLLS